MFFAAGLAIGVLIFPESPRWLLKHGHVEDAAEIMARMDKTTPDSDKVQNEIKEIKDFNAKSGGKKLTWKEFASNGPEMNGWRASVACASQAFQQITGIVRCSYH